ncbi:MAG: 16S rRNA (guanine(527)-N(7))-methyltransferase RsmG [Chloroflexota bacterium]
MRCAREIRRRALDGSREPLPTRVEGLPVLPESYGHALDAGLSQLRLSLDDGQRAAIDGHVRLLLAWTSAINLTSIREPAAVALEQVVDSLTAVAPLQALKVDRFIDLGSGGGYPGIPIAVALPAARALLGDSTAKKARFLSIAADATGLTGTVDAAPVRAEALASDPAHRERWPAVTARAVAGLGELIELAFPLLVRGGRLVAWKRGDLAAELASGERAASGLGGGRLTVVPVKVDGLADHRLVIVEKTGLTSPSYPRDATARRRRPW